MKIFKEKRKTLIIVLLLVALLMLMDHIGKGRNDLLVDVNKEHAMVDLMYFDGEQTKLIFVNENQEKIYNKISSLRLKQIPLEKVSEMKSPCYGAKFYTDESEVEITYCDGYLLKGTAKKLDSGERSEIKHEYELYKTKCNFKKLYDKYEYLDLKREEDRKNEEDEEDDEYYEYYDDEEDEEDDDEEEYYELGRNLFAGGSELTNAEFLCKYNTEFYSEEKNEIPKERAGVSATGVDIDRDLYVSVKIKNEGKEWIKVSERRIQKKIGDKWYDLPKESLYEIYYETRTLPTSQENTFDYALGEYGKLESGKYRAVIGYYEDGPECEGYEVACEFDIK